MYNDYLDQQVHLLNEQYYGKNAMTLAMEDTFSKIKKKIKEDKHGNLDAKTCIKYAKELEKYLKELFNFKTAIVEITNIGSINAFTYAKTFNDTFKGPLTHKEKNKKYGGIRYTDEANRALQVTLSLEIIRKEEMTPAILTAILLHEIGHNFYIENTLAFRIDSFLAGIVMFGTNTNEIKAIDNTITRIIRNNPIYQKIKGLQSMLKRFNGYVMSLAIIVLNASGIFNGMSYVIKIMRDASTMVNPLIAAIKLNTYSNELFADNFATTYGYGPEVAEFSRIFALDTTGFELLDSWNKESKFIKTINDMLLNYTDLFNSFNIFKDRASEVTRAYDQLNYLKKNLNDVKDSKQKECIKKDIELVEKSIERLEQELKEPENSFKNIKFDHAVKNKGELAYRIRKRHYDDNGNWKNLI